MSILESATKGHAVPSFSIFKSSEGKETVDSLIHCFMNRAIISTTNPPALIKAADGHVYQAVYDSRLPVEDKAQVIISFQSHTYGKFAIIRTVKGAH